MMTRLVIWLIPAALFIVTQSLAQPVSGELRVATASNFAAPMHAIAQRFEDLTGDRVTLILGSTGRHYAQVVNGAPFDVMFAADTLRPALLEKQGHGVSGSRFTYALGKLVLWSTDPKLVDTGGLILTTGRFRRMSIANPALAPYGAAARQTLEALGLWNRYAKRLVRGENVGQAFGFVRSGNAELGFVALSQVTDAKRPMGGSYWLVPQELYAPIEQQAILLRDGDSARRFLAYVRSDEALSIILAHGYDTPDAH